MKKQPFDSLTPQDKYNIEKYIKLYAETDCGPLDIVLSYWNSSKRRLYHAFGNELKIKKKIVINRSYDMIQRDLHQIYTPLSVRGELDVRYYNRTDAPSNNFVSNFVRYLCADEKIELQEKKILCKMLFFRNVIDGTISTAYNEPMKLKNYNFTIKNGMKTIRTIQKCLRAIKYPNKELFSEWLKQINLVNRSPKREATLVLSIHPIDFMTMSDNNCNWSSCMSWTQNGCYHAGTIEMMNSNVAIVAYLENKNPYNIVLDEEHILSIPNKSWRELFFVNKNIIIGGKSYPYTDDEITFAAMDFLREQLQKHFHWSYKFINQEYGDIKHFRSNYFLKHLADPGKNQKHKIITHTNGMYHDMVEDTETRYWCCRNKVKGGLKINLSGPVTCMCCGDIINKYADCSSDINTQKICYRCENSRCRVCNTISYNNITKYNYSFCSKECLKEVFFIPNRRGQKRVISKLDFLSNSDKGFFIVAKDKTVQESIEKIFIKEHLADVAITNQTSLIIKLLNKNNYIKGRDFIIQSFPEVLAHNIMSTLDACSVCTSIGKIFIFSAVKNKRSYFRSCNNILILNDIVNYFSIIQKYKHV